MGPAEGERLAGSSRVGVVVVSCWNHCPGAVASSDTSRVRPGRWRLQSVGGMRRIVMASAAHIDAGLPGRMAVAGLWASVQSVTGAQLAAGVQDRVQVCTRGAALAGDGGALQSEARRQQREPGALFPEQRQARAGRGQERGGDQGDWNVREGAARGRRRRSGRWRPARGPSPEHPPPGPRVSRPRSPRPPPIQRPASSRPGSPGNH